MSETSTSHGIPEMVRFAERCQSTISLAELRLLLDETIRGHGFRWFALVHIVDFTKRPPPETLLLTTYPLAWLEEIGTDNLSINDPVQLASARTATGICWSRVTDFIEPTPAQYDILARGRNHGLRSGFTMPLRMSGEPDAAFSVARDIDIPLTIDELIALRHIGLTAFERARTLLHDARGAQENVALTRRQTECVTLVAEGKSDWDIGAILGLSPETVGEYIDGARRKYGVQRRVQLVLRAANDGHLPADAGLPPPTFPGQNVPALLGSITDLEPRTGVELSSLANRSPSPDSPLRMRTSLDHLPAVKRRELARVVQILLEEIGSATATIDGQAAGRVVKVLLYGSYARGGWVDEPHTAKGYQSDFDLLVIVDHQDLTDRVAYWTRSEERLIREFSESKTLRTPVNFIVHTLQEVDQGLSEGRYFFMDVVRDGIALFQENDHDLRPPTAQTPEHAYNMAKEYFDEWYPSATGRLDTARYVQRQGRLKEAAFDLHQTAERFYHCVLLVSTLYSPHVHNLAFLRKQAERLDRRLTFVWPQDNRRERAAFEKLKDAYVKARYSKHYAISAAELDWLSAQIAELGKVVEVVCSEKLALLKFAIKRSA